MSGYDFTEIPAHQKLVNELVSHGMSAIYCSEDMYKYHMRQMDTNTVLVYSHTNGEDVILMGDNGIDVVRFKFNAEGGMSRVAYKPV